MNLEAGFLPRRKIGAERERDPSGQFALQFEQVRDLAIVGIIPNMLIGPRVDQLRIDPHPIAFAPDGTFKDVSYA